MKMSMPARAFRAPLGGGTVRATPPTFSVVIAARNAATSISEAVESALSQTLSPLEVVVSDDGSVDGTAEALAPFQNRITYLRNEHAGVAAARNAALELARGEFFAVLDADDCYLPERLEALGELAIMRPDLDLLCTDAFLEHEDRVVGRFGEGCPFAVADQRAAILERCFCAWPAVRRTTLVAAGGFDESLRTGSDWECAIRLLFNGGVAGLVDEPLYSYRVHGRSLTADRVRTLNDRVAFLEQAGRSYVLGPTERAALARSLAVTHRCCRRRNRASHRRARPRAESALATWTLHPPSVGCTSPARAKQRAGFSLRRQSRSTRGRRRRSP
jgi:hypothetical protein